MRYSCDKTGQANQTLKSSDVFVEFILNLDTGLFECYSQDLVGSGVRTLLGKCPFLPLRKVYYAVCVTLCKGDKWLFNEMHFAPSECIDQSIPIETAAVVNLPPAKSAVAQHRADRRKSLQQEVSCNLFSWYNL